MPQPAAAATLDAAAAVKVSKNYELIIKIMPLLRSTRETPSELRGNSSTGSGPEKVIEVRGEKAANGISCQRQKPILRVSLSLFAHFLFSFGLKQNSNSNFTDQKRKFANIWRLCSFLVRFVSKRKTKNRFWLSEGKHPKNPFVAFLCRIWTTGERERGLWKTWNQRLNALLLCNDGP